MKALHSTVIVVSVLAYLLQSFSSRPALAQERPHRGVPFDGVEYTQQREWSGTLQWMGFYDPGDGSVDDVTGQPPLSFCVPAGSPCEPAVNGDWTGRVEGFFQSESDAFGSSGVLLLGAELELADGGTHNTALVQGTVQQWDQFATTDSAVEFELLGELRLEAVAGGSSYSELNGQVSVFLGIFATANGALVEELGSKCVSLASLTDDGAVLADGEPFYLAGELPADMATDGHAVVLYTLIRTTRTDTPAVLPDHRALGISKGGIIWGLNLGPRIFKDGFEGGGFEQWLLEALNVPRNECDALAGIWD